MSKKMSVEEARRQARELVRELKKPVPRRIFRFTIGGVIDIPAYTEEEAIAKSQEQPLTGYVTCWAESTSIRELCPKCFRLITFCKEICLSEGKAQ